MATTNMQMQTFVAEGMRKFESAEKEEEVCASMTKEESVWMFRSM